MFCHMYFVIVWSVNQVVNITFSFRYSPFSFSSVQDQCYKWLNLDTLVDIHYCTVNDKAGFNLCFKLWRGIPVWTHFKLLTFVL